MEIQQQGTQELLADKQQNEERKSQTHAWVVAVIPF